MAEREVLGRDALEVFPVGADAIEPVALVRPTAEEQPIPVVGDARMMFDLHLLLRGQESPALARGEIEVVERPGVLEHLVGIEELCRDDVGVERVRMVAIIKP
jgi:hypothetical protein